MEMYGWEFKAFGFFKSERKGGSNWKKKPCCWVLYLQSSVTLNASPMLRVIHCDFVFPTCRFIFISEQSGHTDCKWADIAATKHPHTRGLLQSLCGSGVFLGEQGNVLCWQKCGCCRCARRIHLMLIISNVIALTKTFNYHVTPQWQCITGGHSKSGGWPEVCEADPVYTLTWLSLPLRGRLRRLGTNRNWLCSSLTISLPACSSQPRIHNLSSSYPESTAEAPPSSWFLCFRLFLP